MERLQFQEMWMTLGRVVLLGVCLLLICHKADTDSCDVPSDAPVQLSVELSLMHTVEACDNITTTDLQRYSAQFSQAISAQYTKNYAPSNGSDAQLMPILDTSTTVTDCAANVTTIGGDVCAAPSNESTLALSTTFTLASWMISPAQFVRNVIQNGILLQALQVLTHTMPCMLSSFEQPAFDPSLQR